MEARDHDGQPQSPPEPSASWDERAPRSPSARVLAFEALYEHDLTRHPAVAVVSRLAEEQSADQTSLDEAQRLVRGVLREWPELDNSIAALAPAWPLVQMSAVDRNILRLGLHELRAATSAERERAAIGAAIDLAKRYGGDSSPRFVRGVLGRASRRPDVSPGEPDLPGQEPRTP